METERGPAANRTPTKKSKRILLSGQVILNGSLIVVKRLVRSLIRPWKTGYQLIDNIKENPMTKEYTGPKRCDLCQHEEHQPCTQNGRGCNIMTDYWLFKPKGEETAETGCDACNHWKAVKIGKFCPDCGESLIN